jgi:hypothetical protein
VIEQERDNRLDSPGFLRHEVVASAHGPQLHRGAGGASFVASLDGFGPLVLVFEIKGRPRYQARTALVSRRPSADGFLGRRVGLHVHLVEHLPSSITNHGIGVPVHLQHRDRVSGRTLRRILPGPSRNARDSSEGTAELAGETVRHESSVRESDDIHALGIDILSAHCICDDGGQVRDVIGVGSVEVTARVRGIPELHVVRVWCAIGQCVDESTSASDVAYAERRFEDPRVGPVPVEE